MMTRTFSSKEELAERLRAGEKWQLKGSSSVCYYDANEFNPYRYDNQPMDYVWDYCNGKTEWEQVIEKIEPNDGEYSKSHINEICK